MVTSVDRKNFLEKYNQGERNYPAIHYGKIPFGTFPNCIERILFIYVRYDLGSKKCV